MGNRGRKAGCWVKLGEEMGEGWGLEVVLGDWKRKKEVC